MYIEDKKGKKQMFIDVLKCRTFIFVKIEGNDVVLRREGTDRILKCPRHKFKQLFIDISDGE